MSSTLFGTIRDGGARPPELSISVHANFGKRMARERDQEGDMSNIAAVAKQFFEACETGKGWEGCQAYCTPSASFSSQAEPLAEISTLQKDTQTG